MVGFDDSIMMMRGDGIPSLSVAVFCFSSFFSSFLLSFPFSCTHLGGEKRFRGVYTLTGVMGEESTERQRQRSKADEWSSFCRRRKRKKSNFESPVHLLLPFLSFSIFDLKLFNSHAYSPLPTNPQQVIPYYHIHQSQPYTFINHISPRQPLFQTRILL